MPLAITKAVEDAKKNLFTIPKHGSTITHEVLGRFDAARVLLRPASEGTGVIAGGGVRAVLELGGVRNVLAKSLGTTNPINMAKATVVALKELRRPEDVARIRGKQISEVLPLPSIRPQGELEEAAAAVAVVVEQPPAVEEEAPEPKKRAPAKPKAEPVEEAPPVEAPVVEDTYVAKLLVADRTCFGALAFDLHSGEQTVFLADAVVFCTGGHTRLWRRSSSRRDENFGEGFGLLLEAGCELMDAHRLHELIRLVRIQLGQLHLEPAGDSNPFDAPISRGRR